MSVSVNVNYRFDANNFFDTAAKRNALEETIGTIASRLSDDLDAIDPSGFNTWEAVFLNPATGERETLSNPTIEADTLNVVAGGRPLGGAIARGGIGGFSANGDSQFLQTVSTRGESGDTNDPATATDFGNWGGFMAFDSSLDWHFGQDPSGLGPNEFDFRTVAAHEFLHVLGFTQSNDSFAHWIEDNRFTGSQATEAFDGSGTPPLNGVSYRSHWRNDLTDGDRPVAMGPSIPSGVRQMPTQLDLAAIEDVGWAVNEAAPAQEQSFNLDIDANGQTKALTDGILTVRALFGVEGQALVQDALGVGATRTTPSAIESFITGATDALDVDGNGNTSALTDAILVARFLFGFTGQQLIQGAIGQGASRTTAEAVSAHLEQLQPDNSQSRQPATTDSLATGSESRKAPSAVEDLTHQIPTLEPRPSANQSLQSKLASANAPPNQQESQGNTQQEQDGSVVL